MSYPYGNPLSVSGEVFGIAAECGLKTGFTTERAMGRADTPRRAFPRYDAEDLPLGRRPIVNL